MRWLKITVILLIIIFLSSKGLLAPDLSMYQRHCKEVSKERKTRLNELMTAEFTQNNLYELLVLLEAPSPDIIMNQAKIESGWFTSPLFRNHNAIFGMHYPTIRDSYAFEYTIADGGRKVSSYRSWQSSTLDIILLIKYYEGLGYDSANYYKFLIDIHYCELGEGYIKLLKSMT